MTWPFKKQKVCPYCRGNVAGDNEQFARIDWVGNHGSVQYSRWITHSPKICSVTLSIPNGFEVYEPKTIPNPDDVCMAPDENCWERFQDLESWKVPRDLTGFIFAKKKEETK